MRMFGKVGGNARRRNRGSRWRVGPIAAFGILDPFFHIANGEQVRVLEGHNSKVTSVAIAPDSQWVVTVSWDNIVRVWNVARGQETTDGTVFDLKVVVPKC